MRLVQTLCVGLGLSVPAVTAQAAGPEIAAISMAQAGAVAESCLVEMTGDVNQSGDITASDIIYLLNVIFISGPWPEPCMAAGDVDCTSYVTSADVIGLINYVFKSGIAPCDVCQSESAVIWGCFQ